MGRIRSLWRIRWIRRVRWRIWASSSPSWTLGIWWIWWRISIWRLWNERRRIRRRPSAGSSSRMIRRFFFVHFSSISMPVNKCVVPS
ncbi:hypothetical protein PFISCL1PPCAC_1811 [Pristionchus fissidentatus]|uniref:Secreted protein n=1 Tax=Pristionchus fissidentatus TaxID=1538716 RepID=A0AAV5UW09_9BILA|nr:hypothetical protein PFISCL1PPCAC_1811 [Pristionchus fissidentatus]